MRTDFFDAVVVGSGQAGAPLAEALAAAGHRTAIVEPGPSAPVAYGFHATARSGLLPQRRPTLVRGRARFVDARALEIEPSDGSATHVVEGDRVVLNVGARPRIPDIEGVPPGRMLTPTSINELGRLPERLLILGGGVVGLELAQRFRRFGSEVTVLERAARVLAIEDPDVTDELTRILERDGVRIHTSTTVRRGTVAGGNVRLEIERDGQMHELGGSDLLVAVGRVPNTDGLGLDEAGITTDADGYVPVDDRCRTGAESVWAIGDVTGSPPFTHIAYDDYRVVAADVLHGRPARIRDRTLPYTIFTDPELGRVGLTEGQARAQGLSFSVARLPMRGVDRPVASGDERGFMKCLVEDGSDRILGAAILSAQGGEIVSLLQFAIMGRLPYAAIRDGVSRG